jgi:hypothetical protein
LSPQLVGDHAERDRGGHHLGRALGHLARNVAHEVDAADSRCQAAPIITAAMVPLRPFGPGTTLAQLPALLEGGRIIGLADWLEGPGTRPARAGFGGAVGDVFDPLVLLARTSGRRWETVEDSQRLE